MFIHSYKGFNRRQLPANIVFDDTFLMYTGAVGNLTLVSADLKQRHAF